MLADVSEKEQTVIRGFESRFLKTRYPAQGSGRYDFGGGHFAVEQVVSRRHDQR